MLGNKKDVFVKVIHENVCYLHEILGFIINWEYSEEERNLYKNDLGKIEGNTCTFRFVKHVNVVNESQKPFFLSKPDEGDLKDICLDQFEEHMIEIIQ